MSNISNPFIECTARDMSYTEVSNFWCSPFECFSIDEKMLHESLTPIVIEGARGSGKTMILKYISYFCQKEYAKKQNIDILKLLNENKSIGFYFRYSDNFGKLFESLNCSKNAKQQLFKQYYELYICSEIINVLLDMYKEKIISDKDQTAICSGFSSFIEHQCISFTDIQQMLDSHITKTDNWIRKSRYLNQTLEDLQDILKYDGLINKFFFIIRQNIEVLADLNFTIIIDEYENAAEYQVVFNTLIKQVDSRNRITYRIGTRPGGMNMNITEVGNEFLQPDRDFILLHLNYKNITEYKKFIAAIANLRLESNKELRELGYTDIKEILGEREDLLAEARSCLGDAKSSHFDVLKKISKYSNKESLESVVEVIKNEDNPLAEMLNILWVLRGVDPTDVACAMKNYFSNNYDPNLRKSSKKDGLAYKYKLDYVDKYKYQLLFVLLSLNKTAKKYYSFNTFAYLSSGAVNDFISLCRNTFYSIPSKYYQTQHTQIVPVSAEIQAKAAEITAVEQIDKVKLCSDNGTKMYNFLMSMGEVFRSMHKDIYIKYPETNQLAFEDFSSVSQNEVYTSLIKWGVIVKKTRLQSISIGNKKGNIFHLNRIYTPAFNISYRTRGGYNFIISNDLFVKMISNACEAKEVFAFKEAKKEKSELSQTNTEFYQLSLYDQYGDENGN